MHVVLVNPEIPQNTGNIGRTCIAVGAVLWLVEPLGFRLDDHHRRRAGLDYWDHLEWHAVTSWMELVQRLSPRNFWYLSRHANRPYTDVQYTADDVLVFGSESQGLPASITRHATPDRRLRIPMSASARSLNLACAVSVACYELLRQVGPSVP